MENLRFPLVGALVVVSRNPSFVARLTNEAPRRYDQPGV